MESVEARLALDSTEYKNTQKLTWLPTTDHTQTTPTVCYHYDNIITKGVLKPDDDFKDYINEKSMVTMVTPLNDCTVLSILCPVSQYG